MSTVESDLDVPGAAQPVPDAGAPGTEVTAARLARVGDLDVRRLLPLRQRRSVGAWCFVDHYGPASVDGVAGMQVPPHPHIGLQTVTWLIDGSVLHRDSLGSEQLIRPGQLNLMTAGRGIAHSEQSPEDHDPSLHGVQLWLALPDAHRHAAPDFEQHAELPVLRLGGLDGCVFAGSLAGVSSPARVFSAVVGAELSAAADASGAVPLAPGHEHVIFAALGAAAADGTELRPGSLLYLPPGRESVRLTARAGARLFLLGGEPLGETLLMWWNFVGRTPDDIATAARDWAAGQRFGTVTGYRGAPLAAPPLDPVRLARKAR
ncbi:MAG TPA: pirin family protein [Streptosporangiaceae bacterium]|nr:pirin family protein [Streptosporangiaceae bacterium]